MESTLFSWVDLTFVEWTAYLCVLAGLLMGAAGFALSVMDNKRKQAVEKEIQATREQFVSQFKANSEAVISNPERYTLIRADGTTEDKIALPDPSEFVKQLAELAKNLSSLTPAIAAFVLAIILFLFASILASVDRVEDPQVTPSPTPNPPTG